MISIVLRYCFKSTEVKMLRWLSALSLLSCLLPSAPAWAEGGLSGVWKVTSFVNEFVQTKERRFLYGEHPNGYLIITPERFTAIITGEGRKLPQSDEDRLNSFRTMIAYTGLYRVEGDRLTIHVEVAWNEVYTGTDQTRIFRVEGDKLFIESIPAPSPNYPALGPVRPILELVRSK
jgi:hypothetical protein